jgi:hypothetical protein
MRRGDRDPALIELQKIWNSALPTISPLGSAVMLFQGNLKTLGKTFPIEGLGQVANRPGPKRLRTNLLVGEGRKENERHAVPLPMQMRLQLDAVHAGHLDISNHT